MTFNVYYGLKKSPEGLEIPLPGLSKEEASSTIAAIRESNADIVVVQESDDRWWGAVSDAVPDEYPYSLMRRDRRGGGHVLLSRWPIRELEHIPPANDDQWHAALLLELDTPVGPIRMLSVHLTPPIELDGSFTPEAMERTAPIRQAEMERMCPKVSDASTPTIVLGDFNEGDDGLAVECLRDQGFVDALPEFEPTRMTWSWPVLGPIKIGRRLDHVMYNDPLEPVKAWTLESEGTDHKAVLVTFQRPGMEMRDEDSPPVDRPKNDDEPEPAKEPEAAAAGRS